MIPTNITTAASLLLSIPLNQYLNGKVKAPVNNEKTYKPSNESVGRSLAKTEAPRN